MYTPVQLSLLQVDIGLMHPTDDQVFYLGSLLEYAASAIAREGVVLTPDVSNDDMLVSMYAAWLYRKRARDPNATAMPRMIRQEINNRLCSRTMRGRVRDDI